MLGSFGIIIGIFVNLADVGMSTSAISRHKSGNQSLSKILSPTALF